MELSIKVLGSLDNPEGEMTPISDVFFLPFYGSKSPRTTDVLGSGSICRDCLVLKKLKFKGQKGGWLVRHETPLLPRYAEIGNDDSSRPLFH